MLHSLSHSACRLQAEICAEHGFVSVIWGQLWPCRGFSPFQWYMEDQRWAAHFSYPRSWLTLWWKPNSTEKRRESPDLGKCAHPRLPNCLARSPSRFTELKVSGARCCRIHSSIWNPLPTWLRVTQIPQCLFTVTSTLNCFKIQMLWPHPTAFNGFDWPLSSHLAQDEIFNEVLVELAHPGEPVYCKTGYFTLK